MSAAPSLAPPLLDLLGVHWAAGAPVAGLAWEADGASVAFALGDGHLLVADARWPGGPTLAPRPAGGVAVQPAKSLAPAPRRAACHQGACLVVAADPAGGFVTGGDDGGVVRLPRQGDPLVLASDTGGWVAALDCGRDGGYAYASGRHAYRIGPDSGARIALPAPATALAFHPGGRSLAIAHHSGVTLWEEDGTTRLLAWPGYHRALAWSPDGRYLVTGMQENALHGWRVADGGDIEMGGYPGQALSLSFSHDGRFLATSGAMRPVCWGFDAPGTQPPSEAGMDSRTPLTRVACHPRQQLIAAGYHNGAVVLCQPGSREALFIKGSGAGAVNALAWSPDGTGLAIGTQEGLCGWLALPPGLFRPRAAARHDTPENHHQELTA